MKKSTLATILVILLIILGVLIYLYLTLVRPPQARVRARVVGIRHLLSIYGISPNDLLRRPHGVALDKDKNVYITDTYNHRVLVFNERGRFLRKIGKRGEKEGDLLFPLAVAVVPNGNIYVTSNRQDKITIFSSQGKFLKEIDEVDPLIPTIAKNKLYLVTSGQVVIFDLEGKEISRWGRQGKAPGEFAWPGGIFVDKQDNVYVSDSNNSRLQAFDKEGKLLWVNDKTPFGLAEAIVMDDKERLYVMDALDRKVKIFTKKGKKIAELGETGQDEGQFYYPAGIAYAGGNIFWVADEMNHRVQKLRITPPTK